VGIVGINFAHAYTSYEGSHVWPTTGSGKYKHPVQEGADAERLVLKNAAPAYDEFIVLRFDAENVEPYAFKWANVVRTQADYSAALVRIAAEYEYRF
jgi:hypothetical protein